MFLDTYGPALDAHLGLLARGDPAQPPGGRASPPHTRADRSRADRAARPLGVAAASRARSSPTARTLRLAQVRGRHYRVLPPTIEVVNPIGSGDCLLAGLVDAWLSDRPPQELLRHAFACAVANALVWDAGAIDHDDVVRQRAAIVVEPLLRG